MNSLKSSNCSVIIATNTNIPSRNTDRDIFLACCDIFLLIFFQKSRPVSRVMSRMIIYLERLLPDASSDPPESGPGRPIAFYSVLLRIGFTWLRMLPPARQSLTLPFHPYQQKLAVYLCCTIPGVTSAGRYPVSCPLKPGLSSPAPFRVLQPRSSSLLRYLIYAFSCKVVKIIYSIQIQNLESNQRSFYIIFYINFYIILFESNIKYASAYKFPDN